VRVGERDYFWIKYAQACRDLPILFPCRPNLRTQINKIVQLVARLKKCGLISSGSLEVGYIAMAFCPSAIADATSPKTCIGPTQIGMQLRLFPKTPRCFLELALKLLRRLSVCSACRRNITGALLTQAKREK
jgi:hypothetical protein